MFIPVVYVIASKLCRLKKVPSIVVIIFRGICLILTNFLDADVYHEPCLNGGRYEGLQFLRTVEF